MFVYSAKEFLSTIKAFRSIHERRENRLHQQAGIYLYHSPQLSVICCESFAPRLISYESMTWYDPEAVYETWKEREHKYDPSIGTIKIGATKPAAALSVDVALSLHKTPTGGRCIYISMNNLKQIESHIVERITDKRKPERIDNADQAIIMIEDTLYAALGYSSIGISVFWENTERTINQKIDDVGRTSIECKSAMVIPGDAIFVSWSVYNTSHMLEENIRAQLQNYPRYMLWNMSLHDFKLEAYSHQAERAVICENTHACTRVLTQDFLNVLNAIPVGPPVTSAITISQIKLQYQKEYITALSGHVRGEVAPVSVHVFYAADEPEPLKINTTPVRA